MKNHKFIRFVESFILLPAITISSSFASLPPGGSIAATSQIVFSQKLNKASDLSLANEVALAPEQSTDFAALIEKERKDKAEAIDAYFRARGMPLKGTGEKMVEEAEKNELDWRLLPALAARESTGGKYACVRVKNNPFGWNSCKVGFDSYEEAIEVVARNLGGNNPRTKRYYAGKDTKGILRTYNPPHVVPDYAAQVLKIMNAIGEGEVTQDA